MERQRGKGNDSSRFPAGMTERKARATAEVKREAVVLMRCGIRLYPV
jgi:hypothetical protein